MKLRTRLLSFTAAIVMTTGAAFAAIDGNTLADAYLAEGYDFVEVKVGPTQTKVEAIKGNTKIEVIYDNATQEIIKRERDGVDDNDRGRQGKQVRTVDSDFEDDDDTDDDGKGRHGGDDDRDDDDSDDDRRGRDGDDDDGGDDDRGDDDRGGDDRGGDDKGGGHSDDD